METEGFFQFEIIMIVLHVVCSFRFISFEYLCYGPMAIIIFNSYKYLYYRPKPWSPKVFHFKIIINVLVSSFPLHLNTYVMGLRPLEIF